MRYSRQKAKGKRQKLLTADSDGFRQIKSKNQLHSRAALVCGLFFLCLIVCFVWIDQTPPNLAAEDTDSEIERAIFTRQEFFGAPAIVPLPTAEARTNLIKLAEASRDDPQILEKLAELNEKLGRFDESEADLQHLAEIDASKLENLAAFYERRAEFEKEAETLRKILFSVAANERAAIFERLIETARKHDLKQYLKTSFYAEVAKANADVYPIFERLIDDLTREKNYPEALNFVRQAKGQFPARQNILLEKEIELLLETNKPQEAEKVYQAAFDPFWTEAEAQKFYDFLNRQDRLRAYGAEIKVRFKNDPADFDAAIRLALYQNHDYSYGNDDVTPIILKLESAKKSWTTDELITVSRILLQANEADAASRFLYTLYLREDFKANSRLRAKILYQLFEMFSDAENQRLPLTMGDLRFYEDVAQSDPNPGITTGILSLIFSDSNPRENLDLQETNADKLFNRAAAYRIFEEYKRENPASDELAQMYLDIIRLYTATKDTEIAEKTLNEFAAKYENSSALPSAALKLADAFAATNQEEKARQVYQRTLDYLGKQDKPLAPEKLTEVKFSNLSNEEYFTNTMSRNDGINIPFEAEKPKTEDYYDDRKPANFRDYLDRKNGEVTYREVLEKFIASLVKDKKTAGILALYSNEIAKYPNEEWLYEQRLTWLEQTNLTAAKLELYKAALARFQTNGWRDKLARFFVRNKRDDEFAAFSKDIISQLNDTDTQKYLSEFIDGKLSANSFDQQLYIKLYQSAHERFPYNISFTNGLLRFYKTNKQENEWRNLAAEYFFESKDVREAFLNDLAQTNRLRDYLEQSKQNENTIYKLFRADAAARLSDFENAIADYRRLNELYPNTPEFADRLINFTRSFGQKNRELLKESATLAESAADFPANSAEYRTRAGEIYAELGDYAKARGEWNKLISTARGDKEIYLDTATVYWDYFQYADALKTIRTLREKFADDTLYAFESGAILEAQHRKIEAVSEYVKALDAGRDETQKEKAVKRLTDLSAREARKTGMERSKNNQFENVIASAFSRELGKRKNSSFLALGYAEFLTRRQQIEKAENILDRAIAQSADQEFLEAAKAFYQTENNDAGEQMALKRLAETASNPRRTISYRLQLADSFAENQKRNAAKDVLDDLVRQFPTNYGVLTETSDLYDRIGYENESARVLENALPKSRGAYRNALSQKLATRLIELNKLDSAERILTELHGVDKANTKIFDELARVLVRTNKPEAMRRAFKETITELKRSDAERREIESQIADLRTEMIAAFTKLKDYRSAVEQHIEIINREPENEELTENAIAYVERYGGAETLVDYYEKLSAEAFKNYRWNVVLARIYEAGKNDERALKNYRAAIDNQPEMAELYLAVAGIETRRGNYDEALKNIDEVLEITGNSAANVKKKIEILKKAGKFAEIETEKAKLPAEAEKKIEVDKFAEARNLQSSEKEKSREIYRAAFEKLLEDPLSGQLKTADLTGYVESLRDTESLDKLNENLWLLREKLTAIGGTENSSDAGEARKRLSIINGAMIESIASIAKTRGTNEELKNLHEDWQRKIEETSLAADPHQTVSLIQNLSRRAGFGDLEEMILLKKAETNKLNPDRQFHLRNLVNFYNERGAYQKTFDALEKYESDDLRLKAEMAKILGNREKELESLRALYWKPNEKPGVSRDEDIARYLEILNDENMDELRSLTERSSVHQLQLINFLLGKGKRELAHTAIGNANLPIAWRVSRNAETSLALREFDEDSECYFCAALQFDSIGGMVKQTPDKRRFLSGDDWFRLTREYGEWLFEKNDKEIAPTKFLAAMIENQPRNPDEQSKLGAFYLDRGKLKPAIEHLRLAIETDSIAVDQNAQLSALGAAYFKIGRRDYADETWARVLDGGAIQSGVIFFQTLQKYGLREQAQAKTAPLIVKFLETANAPDSEDFQKLIRAVAASFTDEAKKSAYFQAILRKRPKDVSLAAMLVNEDLIAQSEQNPFYESLIKRSSDLNYSDYNFTSVLENSWTKEDAESIYAQENGYKTEEPESDKYDWQKKYLELLADERENAKAAEMISEIEKEINNRYARPAWLREASIKLEIRDNRFNLREAERFIGITVSDSAAEIKTPDVERFNAVSEILKIENKTAEAVQLSETFFARMLALEQYNKSDFSGLARAFFQNGETEKALNILRLMIDAGDETKQKIAFADIAAIPEVRLQAADAAKMPATENNLNGISNALRIAAEIAIEFQQTDAAITFRRRLLEANPSDSDNKIELAKILDGKGDKTEAEDLLSQIISDKNSPRLTRWEARLILNAEIPNVTFDPLSQFYRGTMAEKQNEAATEFYINSLIADQEAETSARQNLIKSYALANKPFAALRLAETDKSVKPDELLKILSESAEKIGDYTKASEFEKARREANAERISALQKLSAEKNKRATDFQVDPENTRKL